jgi:hypothetical protein
MHRLPEPTWLCRRKQPDSGDSARSASAKATSLRREARRDRHRASQTLAVCPPQTEGRSPCSPLIPPQERLPGSSVSPSSLSLFPIEVSSPSSGSIAPACCHLKIDSLPHSATHIGSALSGMLQWGFVITIKWRLAIASTTLSVLSFASLAALTAGGLGAQRGRRAAAWGRAIDQSQFHRPLEKARALARRLGSPRQRSDDGTTVLAASTIPIHPPGGHGRSQGEDQHTAAGDHEAGDNSGWSAGGPRNSLLCKGPQAGEYASAAYRGSRRAPRAIAAKKG